MRICLVTNGFPPFGVGGIITQSYNLTELLHKKGVDITVLSLGDEFEEDFSNGYRVVRLKTPLDSQLKRTTVFQLRVFKWLRKNNDFDIIHFQESTGFFFFLFELISNKRHNTLYAFHHSPISELRFYIKFFFRIPVETLIYSLFIVWIFEELFCLKMSKKIITVSNYSYNVLKSWKIEPEKIDVINNGITCHNKVFLNSSNNITHFLFVGRLVPRKGLDILIDSLVILSKNKIKQIHVDIVGDGPLFNYVKKKITKNNLKNCKLWGYISQNDLNELYDGADCFICPSYLEGFGIVLLEAACKNLAIIANDIEVFKEIFTEDEAIYFEKDDPTDLARKMIYLSENNSKIKFLQRKSLKKANDFSWDVISDRYISLYNKMMREWIN
ncbi:MAG: glycosyltransferase family 4 protein [Methanobacterium formicicum]